MIEELNLSYEEAQELLVAFHRKPEKGKVPKEGNKPSYKAGARIIDELYGKERGSYLNWRASR